MTAALEPGTTLGGRFAIIGVLGAGGTATVYLTVDQLRGEKVALKVVHPHLAADAKVRRRIQREVRASTLLQHEAALVPWDVHELDGFLALSLPYHPGRTLREQISLAGPMGIAEVRTMGARVASALAEAHRSGLLHLDVSANNILVEGGRQPMLTDFGLSRAQGDATRSTSVVGTAGFMAPERMSGERPLPTTDLYGLGCVLYLALTGKAPFPTDHAMGALQAQLTERYPAVLELRKDCPPDLAETVHALLRCDPAARPQSASALADALLQGVGPERTAVQSARAHLEPGNHALIVWERPEDSSRRKLLRINHRKAPNTVEAEVARRARRLMQGVLAYVGLEPGEQDSPERLLVNAVAEEAKVPQEVVRTPPVLLEKRFVLAEHVSEASARRMASDARIAGFHTRIAMHPTAESESAGRMLRALVVMGWIATLLGFASPLKALAFALCVLMIGLTVYARSALRPRRDPLEDLPVAFGSKLDRWLTQPVEGRFTLEDDVPTAVAPAIPSGSRGTQLLARATDELDRLLAAVEQAELNALASSDLRSTAKALRERAEELAQQVDRLDAELQSPAEDLGWVEPRISRLRTKQRAGEPVDLAEITRLEGSLLAARQAEAQRELLESRHLASIAGLLEIAATATRVRRDLLTNPEPASAQQAISALQREAAALERARKELERNQTA